MSRFANQVEKQTIVTRLAVSIYKMSLDQVRKLLDLFEQSINGVGFDQYEKTIALSAKRDTAMLRQMFIARLFVLINQLDKTDILKLLRSFEHPEFQWVREYPRLECFLIVDFAINGRAYRSCIRNISASGVFIETSEHFKVGQDIALCFCMNESREVMPFRIIGKVTRLLPDGIAVQYGSLTHYQRDILGAMIKTHETGGHR